MDQDRMTKRIHPFFESMFTYDDGIDEEFELPRPHPDAPWEELSAYLQTLDSESAYYFGSGRGNYHGWNNGWKYGYRKG